MTTYTALFHRPAVDDPTAAPPAIVAVLAPHFSGSFEVQHGSPNSKEWVLVSFDVDLTYEDVEVALKLAFPLGLGPIWLVRGDIDQARDSELGQAHPQVWSTTAIRNNQLSDADDQAVLGALGRAVGRTFRTYGEVHADQRLAVTAGISAVRDLLRELGQYRRVPETDVLKSEAAQLSAEMAGMIERYAGLHRRWLEVQRLLYPTGIYATNPNYVEREGELNLFLQDVIRYYMDTFAPTDPRSGEPEDSDQGLHDFGWRLINILDGEWDASQQMQVDADTKLVELGYQLNWPQANRQTPEERLRVYRDLEAEFTDHVGHALGQLRRQLGLTDEDVN